MRPFIALLLTLASLARTSSPDFLAGELFRGTYTAHQPNVPPPPPRKPSTTCRDELAA